MQNWNEWKFNKFKNRYTDSFNLRGGGPKIEPIPDENPIEAKIAYETSDELICPLSYHLMIDPVFISSGKTFDRGSIMSEFARQREINPELILVCPLTKEPLTDVLTPNLQMRSITEKFFYQYKDVQYKGSTWDDIRRICDVYQEEQTPEKIEERRRIHEIEDAKRMDERKKKQEQDRKMQEMERRLQEKESVIQEKIQEKKNDQLYIRRLERAIQEHENEMRRLELLLISERDLRLAREAELRAEIERARVAREEEREESERIERERRGEAVRRPIRPRDIVRDMDIRLAERRRGPYNPDPAFWELVREIENEPGSNLRR